MARITVLFSAGAAVLITLVSGSVWAQGGEQDDASYSDGADPTRATPVQREQAQQRFRQGKKLYADGKIEEALAEFDASRAIVASPNARLYRARCLQQLGQLVAAYTEFGRTMVEAMELAKLEARYSRTVEAATEERKALERDLSFVNVTIHHPRAETKVFVNGEEIRRTAWGQPAPAAPGIVEVNLKTPGFSEQIKQVRLEPGQSKDLTFDLTRDKSGAKRTVIVERVVPAAQTPKQPEKSKSSLRPYAYLASGVGAAGIGAFAVFGIMSVNQHGKLEEACPNAECSPDMADEISRGKSQQLWANIGLAVGAVGLGTGITLLLLEPDKQEAGPSVALDLSPSYVGLTGKL